MSNTKYVIKVCYPQRSETIYLYLCENKEGSKKDAIKFSTYEEALAYQKAIEEKYSRKRDNWLIEKE